ncbi:RNA ligase [Achromobacter phage Motura]|uniref:Anti-CBASS protein Acb1 n=1 Tax=Achromobacter phage Motura TaxID=2591403 RepID=A0A514CT12_9CAUD|nr:RNA ligase [Achromobacter phage Motura]QDH83605.1 RNA ligase [Achromobacter phage Motura]
MAHPLLENSMRVAAKVLYSVLRTVDDGFYAWADPSEAGYLALSDLKRRFRNPDLKYDNTTSLHCTLMYHTGPLPQEATMPEDRTITGLATGVECWTDHKQRQILVLRVYSPEIQAIHEHLVSQGFKHGHPDYNAHITLGKFHDEVPGLVDQMNAYLADNHVVIEFQPKVYADTIN